MSLATRYVALVILSLATACSASDGTAEAEGKIPHRDLNGAGRADAGGGSLPLPVAELVSLTIEPPLAELSSLNGSRPEQVFTVIGTRSDGSTTTVSSAAFSLDSLAIGSIGAASGTFAATGVAGGQTQVRVEAAGGGGAVLKAEATVRVLIEHVFVGKGVPADARDKFDKPTRPAVVDTAANLVYPLEGAVMPQNVFPADLQWLTGKAGDLFDVRLEKPHARVRALLVHSGAGFNNHHLVDMPSWRALAQSDPGDPVAVTLSRWDRATDKVINSPMVSFSFARAALTGSVYYWDIKAGRIQRIDDGTNKAISFMPKPSQNCVGCHTVSPSGRYMAGRFAGGDNFGSTFDLTTDLTGDPAPTLFSASKSKWYFSSWSPDEKRLVVSTVEWKDRLLKMLDPFTGDFLAVKGALPMGTHPAWSPDGKEIAYVANPNAWGGENTTGDIGILPVTGLDAVGRSRVIHKGAAKGTGLPAGLADSYPTWSPDSAEIAFAHGGGSRSEDATAALYMMARDGSGVVRLNNACAGADTTNNFQPRFAPFDTGEHFWLSFLSNRSYGNRQQGTLAKAKPHQQIWVTAIRKNAKPGQDPSEVGYWLPGQNVASKNISAYWAPRPCRKDGDGCSVGSECCGGDCRPDEDNVLVCAPPPPEECRQEMMTCSSDGDCCGGLSCNNNVCIFPVVIQ